MTQIADRYEQLTLEGINTAEAGKVYGYFPPNWSEVLFSAAWHELFSMPRFSKGTEALENEVDFDPRDNTWTAWKGALCCRETSETIAYNAATNYLTSKLTGKFDISETDEAFIREAVAPVLIRYEQIYPTVKELVGAVTNG